MSTNYLNNMKNLLFTLFLTGITFLAQAQLSNNYNVTLPANARPANSNATSQAYESGKYKSNSLTAAAKPTRHYYAVDDNITIGFWDVAVSKELQKTPEQRMAELKALSALGSPKNPSIFSTVKFNGIEYIIEKYQRGGSNYIRFYSDYYNDQMISGVIQFNDGGQQSANKLLETFLVGINRK